MFAFFAITVAIGSVYHVTLHTRITLSLTVLPEKTETHTYEHVVENDKSGTEPEQNGSAVVADRVVETDLQKAELETFNIAKNTVPETDYGMTKLVIDDEKDLHKKQPITRKDKPNRLLGKITIN